VRELPLGLLMVAGMAVLKGTLFPDWSWWWVFAPLWIPIGVGLFCLTVATIMMYIQCGSLKDSIIWVLATTFSGDDDDRKS
jgi:O-antigen ligase